MIDVESRDFEAAVEAEIAQAEQSDTEMTRAHAETLVIAWHAVYDRVYAELYSVAYLESYKAGLDDDGDPEDARESAKKDAHEAAEKDAQDAADRHYQDVCGDLGI